MTSEQLLNATRRLQNAGVHTLEQLEFLLHLHAHPEGELGPTCSELAALFSAPHPASITSKGDKFVRLGLVVRGHPDDDRRVVRLRLTRAGRRLLAEALDLSTSGLDATPKR